MELREGPLLARGHTASRVKAGFNTVGPSLCWALKYELLCVRVNKSKVVLWCSTRRLMGDLAQIHTNDLF
jgi:hypothetical protein